MENVVRSEALESFLQTLGKELLDLGEADTREILQELRSHVLDKALGDLREENIQRILAKLGSASELAGANKSARLAALPMLWPPPSVTKIFAASVYGTVATMLMTVGYGFAASWILTALAKPFWPGRVGLWRLDDPTGDLSLSLGRHGSEIGHDLLGWWIIPIGLGIGVAVALLTSHFGYWLIRSRRSRCSDAGAFGA